MIISLLLSTLAVGSVHAAPLTLAETRVVPGAVGGYDYLTADAENHRILAAHSKCAALTVASTTSKDVIEVQLGASCNGVTVDKADNLILMAGPDEKIVAVDRTTLKVVATKALPGPGDAMEWNTKTGKVYVDEDDGTHIWAIDPKTLTIDHAIEIKGAPEWIQYDPVSNRIYQNIKKPALLQVVDIDENKVVADWEQPGVQSPHGLAVISDLGMVVSAGKNGILAEFDMKTGKIVGTAPIAKGIDQMAYDVELKTLYCACNGFISAVKVTPEGLKPLGDTPAPAGAHTLAVDPNTHDVWVAYADGTHSYMARFSLNK